MSDNPVFMLDVDKVNRVANKALTDAVNEEMNAQLHSQLPEIDFTLRHTLTWPGFSNFKLDIPGIDVIVIQEADKDG